MVSNIWTYINGDKTLLVLFPLTEHSVVFDIGGYKGDWASEIFERYHPHICIYEPIKEFYESILNRFDNNPKIEIKDMAAWDECTLLTLGIEKSATGLYCDGPKETVLAIDIFHEIPIHIDLMKINIEGSEYQVLKRIITTNSVYKISNFLIQFHKNVKDHEAQRKIIREYLEQTHELVFDFPYIWEHWRIISYSQARQDVFVLSHYSFSWGSFLDIGCGLPKEINNTYLLEKHGWKGVSIDIKDLNKEWENRETEFIQADALTMNLRDIGLTGIIDYLSLDIDFPDGSNYKMLKRLIDFGFEFKIITIEHNSYLGFDEHEKNPQRELLLNLGYTLECPDVSINGESFEDWWINSKYI